MLYIMIVWFLIGYWIAGSLFAYINAVRQFSNEKRKPKSIAAKVIFEVVERIIGIFMVLFGPVSLSLFMPVEGKTDEEKFTKAWVHEIKQSFLNPRKTSWLWPITLGRS